MIERDAVILVIACGNPLRQDDGAGLRLAQQFVARCRRHHIAVRYCPVQQLLPELAPEMAAPDVGAIYFVDCRVAKGAGDTAVLIERIQPQAPTPAMTHQLSTALLLLYAQALFEERPSHNWPPAWQVSVPGYRFGHGEGLSERCRAAVAAAINAMMSHLGVEEYA